MAVKPKINQYMNTGKVYADCSYEVCCVLGWLLAYIF